jgi:hypothetical protein
VSRVQVRVCDACPVPIRKGDAVSFVGPGPSPTPTSHSRHDPDGVPQPADYGEVVDVLGDLARVAWRFGATTECSIESLSKWHPRTKSHRYRVLFEQTDQTDDVTYTVVTERGEAKAVWLASARLFRDHPDYRARAVEVEDLGTDFQIDPAADLLAWDEVS